MKTTVLSLILLFSLSLGSPGYGQADDTSFAPLQLSLLAPLQVFPKEMSVYGLFSIAILTAENADVITLCNVSGFRSKVNGNCGILQISAALNHVRRDFYGVQLSLIENITGNDFYGIQVGGGLLFLVHVWNFIGNSYYASSLGNVVMGNLAGIQVSPFANVTRYSCYGLQAAAFVNYCGADLAGLQLALYNHVRGSGGFVQAPFWNIADGDFFGLQVGLVNRVREGNLFQISLANNHARRFNGLQASALFNKISGQGAVLQIGGILNETGSFAGWQIGGIVNNNRGSFAGLQTSAGFQRSAQLDGVQIGVINYARRVRGVQIGLLNIADSLAGVQLGGICIANKGGFALPVMLLFNIGTSIGGDYNERLQY